MTCPAQRTGPGTPTVERDTVTCGGVVNPLGCATHFTPFENHTQKLHRSTPLDPPEDASALPRFYAGNSTLLLVKRNQIKRLALHEGLKRGTFFLFQHESGGDYGARDIAATGGGPLGCNETALLYPVVSGGEVIEQSIPVMIWMTDDGCSHKGNLRLGVYKTEVDRPVFSQMSSHSTRPARP